MRSLSLLVPVLLGGLGLDAQGVPVAATDPIRALYLTDMSLAAGIRDAEPRLTQ